MKCEKRERENEPLRRDTIVDRLELGHFFLLGHCGS